MCGEEVPSWPAVVPDCGALLASVAGSRSTGRDGPARRRRAEVDDGRGPGRSRSHEADRDARAPTRCPRPPCAPDRLAPDDAGPTRRRAGCPRADTTVAGSQRRRPRHRTAEPVQANLPPDPPERRAADPAARAEPAAATAAPPGRPRARDRRPDRRHSPTGPRAGPRAHAPYADRNDPDRDGPATTPPSAGARRAALSAAAMTAGAGSPVGSGHLAGRRGARRSRRARRSPRPRPPPRPHPLDAACRELTLAEMARGSSIVGGAIATARLPAALVAASSSARAASAAISTRWGLAGPGHVVVVLGAARHPGARPCCTDAVPVVALGPASPASVGGALLARAGLAVPGRPARRRRRRPRRRSRGASLLIGGGVSPSGRAVTPRPNRSSERHRRTAWQPHGEACGTPLLHCRANRTRPGPAVGSTRCTGQRRHRPSAHGSDPRTRSATRSATSSAARSSSSLSRPIGIYLVVLWLATAYWAFRDMQQRSDNVRSCRTSRPPASSCSPRSSSSSPSGSTRSSGRTRRSARSGSGTWPRRPSSPRSSRSTTAPAASGGSTTSGSSARTAGPG